MPWNRSTAFLVETFQQRSSFICNSCHEIKESPAQMRCHFHVDCWTIKWGGSTRPNPELSFWVDIGIMWSDYLLPDSYFPWRKASFPQKRSSAQGPTWTSTLVWTSFTSKNHTSEGTFPGKLVHFWRSVIENLTPDTDHAAWNPSFFHYFYLVKCKLQL